MAETGKTAMEQIKEIEQAPYHETGKIAIKFEYYKNGIECQAFTEDDVERRNVEKTLRETFSNFEPGEEPSATVYAGERAPFDIYPGDLGINLGNAAAMTDYKISANGKDE